VTHTLAILAGIAIGVASSVVWRTRVRTITRELATIRTLLAELVELERGDREDEQHPDEHREAERERDQ